MLITADTDPSPWDSFMGPREFDQSESCQEEPCVGKQDE